MDIHHVKTELIAVLKPRFDRGKAWQGEGFGCASVFFLSLLSSNKTIGGITMQIEKCENPDCKDGIVIWDEDKEVFMCDKCGALYQ